MSQTINLDLPNDLADHARAVAARTHRRVEDVLLEWLDRGAEDVPVDELPDDRILALGEAHMTPDQESEMSELLARQREGLLESADRRRLTALMGVYRQGMILKAQALKVAVERGLRPPLS